jgi:VWFA-related protein
VKGFPSALLATVAFVAAVSAQTPQAPVFRGGVSLVAIDVNVLDKDGKPVADLTADDFDVRLDGHSQAVRTASYEHSEVGMLATSAPTAPLNAAPATRATATNATAAPEPRTVVMLFDDLSIPATRGKDLLFAGSRFVTELPATDFVGFATTTGMTAINPTRDRAPIQAALRHAHGAFTDPRTMHSTASAASAPDLPLGLEEAIEITAGNDTLLKVVVSRDCFNGAAVTQTQMTSPCAEDVQRKIRETEPLLHQQTERQVHAYGAVINAMRGVTGRKIVVLMTDGLLTAERGKNGTVELEALSHAAASAGVELSVLFASPDEVDMTVRSPEAAAVRRADGLALMTGIQTVADLTGGTFWRVMGQPERFFDFVGQATSGIYHLGVEAPSGDAKRDFALSVHVKRPDLTAHANRVAVAPTAGAAPTAAEQVKDAIATGTPHYGLPLSVSTLVRRGATPTDLAISANLQVPGRPPGPLTVTFGLVDEAGAIKSGRTTIGAPKTDDDYRLSTSLTVHPGVYALRLAVEDAAGHVGSVETRVTAQLEHVGPLVASTLVTAWSGADGKPQFLALDEVPGGATSVGGLVELYGDGAPPANIQIKWDLVDEAQTSIASVVTPATASKDRAIGHAEFPTARLRPGAYELRATVLVGGQPAGTVTAPIRKTG